MLEIVQIAQKNETVCLHNQKTHETRVIKKHTKPGYFFVNSENSRQITPKNAGKTDVNDFEKMTNCLSTICNSKKPIHLLSGRKADRWGVS